jgi:hypothetical protein
LQSRSINVRGREVIEIVLAIAVAVAGCQPETARKADRAAKDVIEQRADLKQAAREEPAQIGSESQELSDAARLFTERKRVRIAALRGEHSVIATQVKLISTMAEYFPLSDQGRADVNNKLTELQKRLDAAGNQIEGLAGVGAEQWSARDDAVRDAMDQLDAARRAAWRALQDAPRPHPTAS